MGWTGYPVVRYSGPDNLYFIPLVYPRYMGWTGYPVTRYSGPDNLYFPKWFLLGTWVGPDHQKTDNPVPVLPINDRHHYLSSVFYGNDPANNDVLQADS